MSTRPSAHDPGFWTERKVAWYQRANAQSDYAERVLEATAGLLTGCRSALDIGAGFGALALPLAQRLGRVTALEPAPKMAAALRASAAGLGLSNVTVVEATWGAVPLAPHDLVLCAHVGALLARGSEFLRGLPSLARRAIILVRDLPGGDDKFFFRDLYPLLRGHDYERCCAADETLAELRALGITPTVTPITYSSDQPFYSLDEACDFWTEYMGLDGPDSRAWLRTLLASRLRHDGPRWIAPLRKRAAVIQWRIDHPALTADVPASRPAATTTGVPRLH